MGWHRMGKSKNTGVLGYRELNCFNQALLAKQGWRLQQALETLVARIFQEKYYPGGTFSEAPLGKRPSNA
jgi:hypothetical protein